MKNINKILLAISFWAVAGVASAAQITGSIGFTGSYQITDGTDVVGSFLDGTTVDILSAQTTGNITGDFAAEGIVEGQAATYSDFVYDPVGAVDGIWRVGSFVFDLYDMVQVLKTDSFLVLSGTGYIGSTTAGLDATFGYWNFSANSAGSNFTWSSSSAVPEPGIALLLGIGLIGFGVSRKFRQTA